MKLKAFILPACVSILLASGAYAGDLSTDQARDSGYGYEVDIYQAEDSNVSDSDNQSVEKIEPAAGEDLQGDEGEKEPQKSMPFSTDEARNSGF